MHEQAMLPAPPAAAPEPSRAAGPATASPGQRDRREQLRRLRVQGQQPLARRLADVVRDRAGRRSRAAVLARKTGIVDDVSDPVNQVTPGTGRGMHVENAGTPQATVHPTVRYGPLRNSCATRMEALLLPGIDDLGGNPLVWPWLATHLRCAWVFIDQDGNQQATGSQSIPNKHG